jgi:hypothetical protein
VIHDTEKKTSEYAVIQYGIKASPFGNEQVEVMFWVCRQALLTEKPGRISLVQGRASSILIGRIFDAVRAEILPLKIGSM